MTKKKIPPQQPEPRLVPTAELKPTLTEFIYTYIPSVIFLIWIIIIYS